ncbi:UNVERIFIED_CONTAM: hypothetical protein FKN15_060358 [Acipenser sinensis]
MTGRQPISSQLSPVNKTLPDSMGIHGEYEPPTGSRMHLTVSAHLAEDDVTLDEDSDTENVVPACGIPAGAVPNNTELQTSPAAVTPVRRYPVGQRRQPQRLDF